MTRTISATELKERLKDAAPPILLHVLPDDAFRFQRIPGSRNACVYEMAFLDAVQSSAASKDDPIVVYGAGEPSQDSAAAASKLAANGYTNVADFRGGLTEWVKAGLPTDSDGPLADAPKADGRFVINAETSVVRWTGRNLFNHHNGTVRFREGELTVEAGRLTSASFALDMNSITNEDLADPQWNAMLIRHLRDEDFFAVDRFPTATFVSREARPIDSTPGMPNYEVVGELTIRGVNQPSRFLAVIAAADEGHLTGQAQFEIDRTQFGSHYGSGRFFAFLGKHIVNDLVHLHVKINAEKAGA
jgi:polyisoprenoid-binding protein YceI